MGTCARESAIAGEGREERWARAREGGSEREGVGSREQRAESRIGMLCLPFVPLTHDAPQTPGPWDCTIEDDDQTLRGDSELDYGATNALQPGGRSTPRSAGRIARTEGGTAGQN